jgi:hypothetical protein
MSGFRHIPSKKCLKNLKILYRVAYMSKQLQNFKYSSNNGTQSSLQSLALLLMLLSARTMVWALSAKVL